MVVVGTQSGTRRLLGRGEGRLSDYINGERHANPSFGG